VTLSEFITLLNGLPAEWKRVPFFYGPDGAYNLLVTSFRVYDQELYIPVQTVELFGSMIIGINPFPPYPGYPYPNLFYYRPDTLIERLTPYLSGYSGALMIANTKNYIGPISRIEKVPTSEGTPWYIRIVVERPLPGAAPLVVFDC
jgi:hypothetical protein